MNMLAFAIIGHLAGDYLFQNDYLAQGKKKSSAICAAHCLIWTGCVLLFTAPAWFHWWVPIVLFVTHFIQDRGGLVLAYMKLMGQKAFASPPMSPWSIIVVDNTMHLVVLAGVARIIH